MILNHARLPFRHIPVARREYSTRVWRLQAFALRRGAGACYTLAAAYHLKYGFAATARSGEQP